MVGPLTDDGSRSGPPNRVDSRQRPAAHASAWRSGIGRQLTTTTTSPASAINLRQLCRRGRARRPREPTQAVLRVCCRTRAPCAALRAAPRTGLLFCDYPQFIEIPDLHHCTKADVAAF
ncbi:hypothetical protein EVAR_17082_1 [Eumeta japonica]|uniref:Uncharacterized protein n=1 Tax=Eumeta variegata TaxID=151549 RepID=A0A4C1V6U4_EUMVA|nr:hypothetical protein EVAR_17082_1 [Eumeta japonica]